MFNYNHNILLHDNAETKYDCGRLLFEYDANSGTFICRILDKTIASELIFLNQSNGTVVTFGDYDGKALHFPSESRPLRRLIRFRAIVNRMIAIKRGYIESTEYRYLMDDADWSPGTIDLSQAIIDWRSKIPSDSFLREDDVLSPE